MNTNTTAPTGVVSSKELSPLPLQKCTYNGGTCKRRGCAAGCQASTLCAELAAQRDSLIAALRKHILTYQVDDQMWDREAAADRAVARMLNTERSGAPRPTGAQS